MSKKKKKKFEPFNPPINAQLIRVELIEGEKGLTMNAFYYGFQIASVKRKYGKDGEVNRVACTASLLEAVAKNIREHAAYSDGSCNGYPFEHVSVQLKDHRVMTEQDLNAAEESIYKSLTAKA